MQLKMYEGLHRANSRVFEWRAKNPDSNPRPMIIETLAARFDVQAEVYMGTVIDEPSLEEFILALPKLCQAGLHAFCEIASIEPVAMSEEANARFDARISYWKAEASSHLRKLLASGTGAQDVTLPASQTAGPTMDAESNLSGDESTNAEPTPFVPSGLQPPEEANEDKAIVSVKADRTKLIEDFQAKGKANGMKKKITHKMIAHAANRKWNDRTTVTWWKRNDEQSTITHDSKIRAVLMNDPAELWPELMPDHPPK